MSKQAETADRPIAKLTKDVLTRVWPLFGNEPSELPEFSALICDGGVVAIQLPRQRYNEQTTRYFMAAFMELKECVRVELVTVNEITHGCFTLTERRFDGGNIPSEDEEKYRAAIIELKAYYELAITEGRIFREEDYLACLPTETPSESPEATAEATDSKEEPGA